MDTDQHGWEQQLTRISRMGANVRNAFGLLFPFALIRGIRVSSGIRVYPCPSVVELLILT